MPGPESGPESGPPPLLETVGGGGVLLPPESTSPGLDDSSGSADSFALWEQELGPTGDNLGTLGDDTITPETEAMFDGENFPAATAAIELSVTRDRLDAISMPEGADPSSDKLSAWRSVADTTKTALASTDAMKILSRTESSAESLRQEISQLKENIGKGDETAQAQLEEKMVELAELDDYQGVLRSEVESSPEFRAHQDAYSKFLEVDLLQQDVNDSVSRVEGSLSEKDGAENLVSGALVLESQFSPEGASASEISTKALDLVVQTLATVKPPEGTVSYVFREMGSLLEGSFKGEGHKAPQKIAAKILAEGLKKIGMTNPDELSNVLAELGTGIAAKVAKQLIENGSIPGIDSVKQLLSKDQNQERAAAKAAKAEAKAAEAAETEARAKAKAEAKAARQFDEVRLEMMSNPNSVYSRAQQEAAEAIGLAEKAKVDGLATPEDVAAVRNRAQDNLRKIVQNEVADRNAKAEAAKAEAKAAEAAEAEARAEAEAAAAEKLPFSMNGLSGMDIDPADKASLRADLANEIRQTLASQPSRSDLENLFRSALRVNMGAGETQITAEIKAAANEIFAEALLPGNGLVPENIALLMDKMPSDMTKNIIESAVKNSIQMPELVSELGKRNPDQAKITTILDKVASVIRILPEQERSSAWRMVSSLSEGAAGKRSDHAAHAVEKYVVGHEKVAGAKRKAIGAAALRRAVKSPRGKYRVSESSRRYERIINKDRVLSEGARSVVETHTAVLDEDVANIDNQVDKLMGLRYDTDTYSRGGRKRAGRLDKEISKLIDRRNKLTYSATRLDSLNKTHGTQGSRRGAMSRARTGLSTTHRNGAYALGEGQHVDLRGDQLRESIVAQGLQDVAKDGS